MSEVAGEDSCRKAGSEDDGVANVDMAAKGDIAFEVQAQSMNVWKKFGCGIPSVTEKVQKDERNDNKYLLIVKSK
ncbi:hypothetical protein CR513_29099, partial [Mucuna pruriens]